MIFRMSSWEGMQAMLTQIFTDFHLELLPKVAASYKYILLIMLMGFTLHFLPHRWNVAMVALLKRGGVVLDIVLLVVAIYIVIQVKSSEIQPFIYFQF
jgi:alginate O-acetyltransferase complex protein AlgI